MCIKASTRSIFKKFQNKSECKLDFGCAIELAEHSIQVLAEEGVVEGWYGKIKNSLPPFFKLRVIEEKIEKIEIFF